MYQRFLNYIQSHQLATPQDHCLLAVSGGVDSVVLVHLFSQSNIPFGIAHAHFGLRGNDSDADAAFVRDLAQAYKVYFLLKNFATVAYAKKHKLSTQMAARALRYEWFQDIAQAQGYTKIVTGHHHNDQLETFLYNFTKGTGIAGLRGIPVKQGSLIRPLLFATKQEIVGYAQKHGLAWRQDVSNSMYTYHRNRLRHQVIPSLERINPSLVHTFKRTVKKLQQVEMGFQAYIAEYKKQVWQDVPPYVHVWLGPLQGKPWAPVALADWLAPLGFSFDPLQAWWDHPPQPGKMLFSRTHWLLAERAYWVAGRKEAQEATSHTITAMPYTLDTTHWTLHIGSPQACAPPLTFPASSQEAWLDYGKLTLPLEVRPWQPGDRFRPLGMAGKHKKVSDFFVDRKVPLCEKAHSYVITSAGKIVWLVGHHMDEFFRITSATSSMVVCRLVRK